MSLSLYYCVLIICPNHLSLRSVMCKMGTCRLTLSSPLAPAFSSHFNLNKSLPFDNSICYGLLMTLIISSDYFSIIEVLAFLMEPLCLFVFFCTVETEFLNYVLINFRRQRRLFWWSEGSRSRQTVKYEDESCRTRN